MAEHAHEYHDIEPAELPRLDLAAHIAASALRDPTYRIDYTHPSLVDSLAEELGKHDNLEVRTPTVYAAGSNAGHKALRVRAVESQLAQVIPFPRR